MRCLVLQYNRHIREEMRPIIFPPSTTIIITMWSTIMKHILEKQSGNYIKHVPIGMMIYLLLFTILITCFRKV